MKRFSHWHVWLFLFFAAFWLVVDTYNVIHDGVNLNHWIPFLVPIACVAFARIVHIVHRT